MMPLALAHVFESFGLLLITAALACWLLTGTERLRLSGGVLVLLLAPLVLAGAIVGDETTSLPQLSPALLLAGVLAGLAALALVATLFVRWPRLVLPAALAVLAFRIPLAVGGDSVRLLLPLYLTIGGAVLAAALSHWRGRTESHQRAPKLLDAAIVGYLALYALQSLWASDTAVATQNFCFFYAPFALLYGLALRQHWDAQLLRRCLVTLVGVALLLVAGGFVEFAQGRYLITFGGAQPSDFDPWFRVQSFFFDPNIYGRFLVVVMLAVCSLLLWTSRLRRVAATSVVLALLWAGLVLSLSQSSFAALLAGLVVLAALRWNTRRVLTLTGGVLLAGLVVALAVPSISGIDLRSSKGAETTTSGRFDLVTGAVTLWSQKPLFGHGSGEFSDAYRANKLAKHTVYGPATTTKSHTSPLTVAAEQGLFGLLAWLLLVGAGFAAVFRRVRADDGPAGRPGLVARIAVAAAFTAIFVHSLAYAALLEDPLTWLLLGCAVSLALIPRRASTTAEAEPSAADGAGT